MRTLVAATALVGAILLASGCATTPPPAPAPKAAPKPVAQPKPVLTAPKFEQSAASAAAPKEVKAVTPVAPETPIVAPKLSPEAAALIERLTHASEPDTLPHEVSEATSFPSALKSLEPGAPAPRVESDPADGNSSQPPARGLTADGNTTALVERDWTGLVLIPIAKSLSKAHTSDVRLTKVEAHPLNDGRVRVWTRVHNIGHDTLPAEIACEFRMRGAHATSPYFYQLDVPGNGYRDVFFVSPDGELNAYTVLVRSADSVRR